MSNEEFKRSFLSITASFLKELLFKIIDEILEHLSFTYQKEEFTLSYNT